MHKYIAIAVILLCLIIELPVHSEETIRETNTKYTPEIVADAVQLLITSPNRSSDVVNEPLIIGPALAYAFSEDPALSEMGIPTTFNILIDESEEIVELDGRTFMKDDLVSLFQMETVKKMFEYFSEGRYRSARKAELETVASFLPFPTESDAFVVLDTYDSALIVFLHENKIFFLDLISEYTNVSVSAEPDEERALEPTDLVAIHLLDDNQTYLDNIKFEDMMDYTNAIIEAVKNYYKDWSADGFDLIIEITLFSDQNAEISAGSRPTLDKEESLKLISHLMKIQSPFSLKDPIAWRIIFQVNNGSGLEITPE